MSISTSASLFSMNTSAARYVWRYALGARRVARPLWLKRLSGGEHEKAFDFSDFSGLCQSNSSQGSLSLLEACGNSTQLVGKSTNAIRYQAICAYRYQPLLHGRECFRKPSIARTGFPLIHTLIER